MECEGSTSVGRFFSNLTDLHMFRSKSLNPTISGWSKNLTEISYFHLGSIIKDVINQDDFTNKSYLMVAKRGGGSKLSKNWSRLLWTAPYYMLLFIFFFKLFVYFIKNYRGRYKTAFYVHKKLVLSPPSINNREINE